MNESQKLQLLMEDTASEMEKLGYSKSSMLHYHEVWNRYLKYTVNTDINWHGMEQFLSECYRISADTNPTTRYQRGAIRTCWPIMRSSKKSTSVSRLQNRLMSKHPLVPYFLVSQPC